MKSQGGYVGMGESFQFSYLCNPDFIDAYGASCQYWQLETCYANAQHVVSNAVVTEQGILESGLSCPSCGCGEFLIPSGNGAGNLNDLCSVMPGYCPG